MSSQLWLYSTDTNECQLLVKSVALGSSQRRNSERKRLIRIIDWMLLTLDKIFLCCIDSSKVNISLRIGVLILTNSMRFNTFLSFLLIAITWSRSANIDVNVENKQLSTAQEEWHNTKMSINGLYS